MVRNGSQSLNANDVMVNALGLPGGVLKIRIDRRITSNEGSCVKVVSCLFCAKHGQALLPQLS